MPELCLTPGIPVVKDYSGLGGRLGLRSYDARGMATESVANGRMGLS
jgi:hypothetical protein